MEKTMEEIIELWENMLNNSNGDETVFDEFVSDIAWTGYNDTFDTIYNALYASFNAKADFMNILPLEETILLNGWVVSAFTRKNFNQGN